MSERRIVYIYDEKLLEECDRIPVIRKRASLVHDLITGYQILEDKNVTVASSKDATEDELKYFHSSSYLEFLRKVYEQEDSEDFEEEQLEFGLDYDCPLIERTYDVVKAIGGSSLTAAKYLVDDECDICINWFGGWHHAQRDYAEGFCYVNDVVLAIQKLTEKFKRILYIDLDVHHGNGVQNAFELSKKVLTLSFHKYAPGFYPSSGSVDDVGVLMGKYYSINVPYLDGIGHNSFLNMFLEIFPRVVETFGPAAFVVQCGADALNGDPLGQCNLTVETYETCIANILLYNVPTLFLGGGGYNFPNAARLWTSITALATGQKLPEDIPDDIEAFLKYGPGFELKINAGNQRDCNSMEYQTDVIAAVLKNVTYIAKK